LSGSSTARNSLSQWISTTWKPPILYTLITSSMAARYDSAVVYGM